MAIYPVDLHVHTYNSDGSDCPEAILYKAKERGLKVIAFTDHDYDSYSDALNELAKQLGILLVSGMELSCTYHDEHKVHLLAYHLSRVHPHIDALVHKYQKQAMQIRRKMIHDLVQLGYDIDYKRDVQPFMHSTMLYKQHIALALEAKGYGQYSDLFQYFFKDKATKLPDSTRYIEVQDAIRAIHQDGGIAILAHPSLYGSIRHLDEYIQFGLDGIEISHPSYKDDHLSLVLSKENMIHSGGSDYHGATYLSDKRQLGNYGLTLEQFTAIKERMIQE